jgi:hypothetical protein
MRRGQNFRCQSSTRERKRSAATIIIVREDLLPRHCNVNETVYQQNYGLEYSFLKGAFSHKI